MSARDWIPHVPHFNKMHTQNIQLVELLKLIVFVGKLLKYSKNDKLLFSSPHKQFYKKSGQFYKIEVKCTNWVNILKHASSLNICNTTSVLLIPRKFYSLFNYEGKWSEVIFICNNNKASIKRWVKVIYNNDSSCNSCYVMDSLFHNISKQLYNSKEFSVCYVKNYGAFLDKFVNIWNTSDLHIEWEKKYLMNSDEPIVVKNIKVSLIKSSYYSNNLHINEILKDYFNEYVAVCVGDVLSIPIPSCLRVMFTSSNSIIPPVEFYIKVISIDNNSGDKTCYLVHSEKSSLFLLNDIEHNVIPKQLVKDCSMQYPCNMSVMQCLTNIYNAMFVKDYWQSVQCLSKHTKNVSKDEEHAVGWWCEFSKTYKNLKLNSHLLILGEAGSGYHELINTFTMTHGLHKHAVNCWNIKGDTSASTIAKLHQKFLQVKSTGPSILLLEHIHCLAQDKEGNYDPRVISSLKEEVSSLYDLIHPVIIVGTASNESLVVNDLWNMFSHHINLDCLDANERKDMLLLMFPHSDIDVNTLTLQTAGFQLCDFMSLRRNAYWTLVNSISVDNNNIDKHSIKLLPQHIDSALAALQESRCMFSGSPRIPQVKWSDVGGLENAKREIINTIQLPLKYPGVISSKLSRSGILLYGPPGTGKTLLAKAVATECGLNFMSVKGPELLNMYVGQSEKNVRQVFASAKSAAPCIIFFDEFDSLAPNRGQSGDSGGVADRIVSALLAELDGVGGSSDVYVLAATNRPDLIDPGLLRAGRFEKRIFLGACDNKDDQIKILKAVAQKIPLSDELDLNDVVQLLPMNLTGADIYALVTDAFYNALRHVINDHSTGSDYNMVAVGYEDFEVSVKNLVPSVSMEQLKSYESMQR